MSRRVYHVCESTSGAMGASGTVRRVAGGLTKREAEREQKRRMRDRDPRTVYFVEWEWR